MARQRISVALVEDQPLLREILSRALARFDDLIIAYEGESGAEALSTINHHIDVAVIDVSLPDANGIDVAAELKQLTPGLGIVSLSAVGAPSDLDEIDDELRSGWSYLLKQTAADIDVLHDVITQTSQGGTVIDPALKKASSRKS